MQTPRLIETPFRNYLEYSLKKSHNFKTSIHYYALNAIILALVVILISGWLYYCYSTKVSQEDKIKKNIDDHNEIVKKVRTYHYKSQNSNPEQITNLPVLPNNLF
jgi:hypothetical protein